MENNFWKNKRVLITGHTGFKGSWLSVWLNRLGAKVAGYALEPPTDPSLYARAGVEALVDSVIADVRDGEALTTAMLAHKPEIVFHLAAQPIVRDSYVYPKETYEINIMGTVNLFEAVRSCSSVRVVVNVTTDKCYKNMEIFWGYREYDPLGGYDPYSNSKACSELITDSYRSAFFPPEQYGVHGVAIASARAGNVIGGGDWAKDRLVPDCIQALSAGSAVLIRNPGAIRPWQHVLEPLRGYLTLAQALWEKGSEYSGGWNFGPRDEDARPVGWVVDEICKAWGSPSLYQAAETAGPHEANYLKLDCTKAAALLNWRPVWNIETAIGKLVAWHQAEKHKKDMLEICIEQLAAYETALSADGQ